MTWNEFRCPANLALFLPLFAQPKSTTESIRMPAARNPLKTQAELGLYGRSAYRRKTRQNGCPLGSGPGGRRFESFRPDHFSEQPTSCWRKNSPLIYLPHRVAGATALFGSGPIRSESACPKAPRLQVSTLLKLGGV